MPDSSNISDAFPSDRDPLEMDRAVVRDSSSAPRPDNAGRSPSPGAAATGTDAPRTNNGHMPRHVPTMPPIARKRDAQGHPVPRTVWMEPTLPGSGQLATDYREALELIQKLRPLRAHSLRDAISRVDEAGERYMELQRAVEEQMPGVREELRQQIEELEQKIQQVYAEMQQKAQEHDQKIAPALEERARKRVICREACVRAQQIPPAHLDADDEASEEPDTPPALPPGPSAAPVSQERSSTGFLQSVVQGFRNLVPVRPAPNNTEAPSSTQSPEPPAPMPAPVPASGALVPAPPTGASAVGVATATPWPQALSSRPRVPQFTPRPEEEIPFPIEEAKNQAPSYEAIASELGIPADSAAYRALHPGDPRFLKFMHALALVACGGIFGVSLGLITRLVDMQILMFNPGKVLWQLIIILVLGIALFWLIGRTVHSATAILAEHVCNRAIQEHTSDQEAMERWMRSMARWSMVFLLLVVAILILIEAHVEKEGIVQTVNQTLLNKQIAQGVKKAAVQGLSELAGWMLALIASVPFVLFHIYDAWITVHKEAYAIHLRSERARRVYEIARGLYEQRVQAAREAAEKAAQREEEIWVQWQQKQQQEEVAAVSTPGEPEPSSQDAPESASQATTATPPADGAEPAVRENGTVVVTAPEASTSHGEAPVPEAVYATVEAPEPSRSAGNGAHDPADPQGTAAATESAPEPYDIELLVQLARADQEAREARQRVRELRGKKNDDMKWYRSQIQQLEQQLAVYRDRLQKAWEPDPETRNKLEDAYHNWLASIYHFDRLYQQEMARIEPLLHGGWIFRIWERLFQRPMYRIPKDLSASPMTLSARPSASEGPRNPRRG
ncbi:MAG: hypothetical protein NZ557_00745 [Chthonomonadaceae bacterium]|nr:hypothetical protein [Chthonomonadaceae bacterium]